MRDLFEPPSLGDPTEVARRSMRGPSRARFYKVATVEPEGEGFAVRLDGKPVRTPARGFLAAPSRSIAEALAAEWNGQGETIKPATMPLTRLANAILDGVADAPGPVAAEVEKYLGSDLVCYRAGEPAALVEMQDRHWNPVLDWARDALGARFVLSQGITFVEQPTHARTAASAAIPSDPWRLGAVSTLTTITGSALLALALCEGAIDLDAAWGAAHVDEDFAAQTWGHDDLATARRSGRRAEAQAAVLVLDSLRD